MGLPKKCVCVCVGGGGGGGGGGLDSLQIYKGETEKVVHNMLHDQQPQ